MQDHVQIGKSCNFYCWEMIYHPIVSRKTSSEKNEQSYTKSMIVDNKSMKNINFAISTANLLSAWKWMSGNDLSPYSHYCNDMQTLCTIEEVGKVVDFFFCIDFLSYVQMYMKSER